MTMYIAAFAVVSVQGVTGLESKLLGNANSAHWVLISLYYRLLTIGWVQAISCSIFSMGLA